MDFFKIAFVLSIFIFIFFAVGNRMRKSKEVDGLTPLEGIITGSQFKLTGESATVYVDVKYVFNKTEYYAYNLTTSSITDRNFQIGSAITVVVDASNLRDCRVYRPQVGDDFLRYLTGMLLSPSR